MGEWHQSIGILLQYGDEDAKGEPQKFPIWSLDCPEQSAWIWDTLPLPPTDPAAQQGGVVGTEAEGAATASGSSSSTGNSAASADPPTDMPPPPVPTKKALDMPPPPLPLKKRPPKPEGIM